MTTKICTKCNNEKITDKFIKRKESKDGYRNICKKCESERLKTYNKNNKEKGKDNKKKFNDTNPDYHKNYGRIYRETYPEKIKEKDKKYREINKEKINERIIKWQKSKPHIMSWRDVLKNSLTRLGQEKESKTIELLGYSALDLRDHMIKLFTDGMSWSNHGEWHIDHIKPVSKYPKDTHTSIVNALSNLQPLWATTREINGVIYEGNLNKNKY